MGKVTANEVTFTGTVYCDWNAFSFVTPLPDPKYWQRGDIVVWSWSGNSKQPSSKSNDGMFAVSVITGVRKLRRSKLKVKRTRVHRNLPFSSEQDREQQLSALVTQLRGLKGRTAVKGRGGFEVTLMPPAEKPTTAPRSQPEAAPPAPSTTPPPTSVPRGRLKPGIRSEAPATAPAQGKAPVGEATPVPAAAAPASSAAPVAASAARPVSKTRRRRKKPNPNQGELF